jgi:formylglycine-generating enzyme required for sulfatase activity
MGGLYSFLRRANQPQTGRPAGPDCNKDAKYADENPRHRVKISKALWMSRTEVTAGAYDKYLAEIPGRQEKDEQGQSRRYWTIRPIAKTRP